MKLVSSILSVLVFAIVIFGAPIYDAVHGNWPGAKYAGPKSAAAIRSGQAASVLAKTLENRSSLDGLVRPRYNELAFLVMGETPKGVVVGPNDWLFPQMRVGPSPPTYAEDLGRAVAALGSITRFLEARGTRVIFELVPRRTALYPEELPKRYRSQFRSHFDEVRDAMLAEGLDVPDIRPALMEGGEVRYMRNDEHWKPSGAKAAAKVIADKLRAGFGDAGPPGPPVDVVFREYPGKLFRGYQQRVLAFTEGGLVDQRFDEEIVGIHAVAANNENKRLDGAKDYRPILLVGTSYSRHPFFGASQFIGHLGVDIQDYSKDGYAAGFRMVEIFRKLLTGRQEFPEVLIWEFPEDFPTREGAYFYEPLESIVAMLDSAPFEARPLGDELRTLLGIDPGQEQPPMIRAVVKGKDAAIVYKLDEPVLAARPGERGSVFCFDFNPSAGGPHLGTTTVLWGGGEPYKQYGAKEIYVRRSNWLHPMPVVLTVPKGMPDGAMVDRIVVKPYSARSEIVFGRAELWTPTGEAAYGSEEDGGR